MPSLNKQIKDALLMKPYPFQRKGIKFMHRTAGRCLLAHDMGLGKSLQTLGFLAINPEKRPALIVVPSSLKINWEKETSTHIRDKATIINGKKPYALTTDGSGIYIINYDIIDAWKVVLKKMKFQVMIMDECHYTKNRKSLRTKACRTLSRTIPSVIGLSGTPMVNRPAELFPVLNMINSLFFPSWWPFAQRYCGAKRTRWGWDFNGASNLDELYTRLQPIMSRYKKEDVLTELPPKQRVVIPMETDNAKAYRAAKDDFLNWLATHKPGKEKTAGDAEALVKIGYLKRLAAEGKLTNAIKWIQNYLDDSNKKLVVFCCHKEIIGLLEKEFKKISAKVDGSVTGPDRHKAVESFQSDPKIRVFLGNIQAAGVGLTLTAADATCFVELGWTPGGQTQAEDRVHRIGQKSDSVYAYYLVAQGTIEEDLCEILQEKQKIISQAIDGKITDDMNIHSQLMKKLKGK